MFKTSTFIMRMVLLLMLFQFFAPCFFSLVAQNAPNTRDTYYHIQHTFIVAPLLLKEKDEKELDKTSFTSNQTPLLDLTIHGSNLKATHSCNSNYVSSDVFYDSHPALFTSYCTFLIWNFNFFLRLLFCNTIAGSFLVLENRTSIQFSNSLLPHWHGDPANSRKF